MRESFSRICLQFSSSSFSSADRPSYSVLSMRVVCSTSIFAYIGIVTAVLSLLSVWGDGGELVGGVCGGVPSV